MKNKLLHSVAVESDIPSKVMDRKDKQEVQNVVDGVLNWEEVAIILTIAPLKTVFFQWNNVQVAKRVGYADAVTRTKHKTKKNIYAQVVAFISEFFIIIVP